MYYYSIASYIISYYIILLGGTDRDQEAPASSRAPHRVPGARGAWDFHMSPSPMPPRRDRGVSARCSSQTLVGFMCFVVCLLICLLCFQRSSQTGRGSMLLPMAADARRGRTSECCPASMLRLWFYTIISLFKNNYQKHQCFLITPGAGQNFPSERCCQRLHIHPLLLLLCF